MKSPEGALRLRQPLLQEFPHRRRTAEIQIERGIAHAPRDVLHLQEAGLLAVDQMDAQVLRRFHGLQLVDIRTVAGVGVSVKQIHLIVRRKRSL